MATWNGPAPRLQRLWPWFVLAAMVAPAVWLAFHYPADLDGEYPGVVRPNFSPHPPPAYRLAEPGDTIDRIAIYVSSMAIVLALTGFGRTLRRAWLAALAVGLAAFWYAANPWPTFDGWHGIAWRTMLDPAAPRAQRVVLAVAALALCALVYHALAPRGGSRWVDLWRTARKRGVAGLFIAAVVLTLARQVDLPGVEPVGYWPRWAFVWALVAFALALLRLQRPEVRNGRRPGVMVLAAGGTVVWFMLVTAGIELTWYHRPIDRLRAVVPGKIYMCAMPTARGLEVAQSRHRFKTIINLFPEDTKFRSPRLPEELQFAKARGLRYVGSPSGVTSSNEFLDLTLRLAQDPDAWPILVHCHACMDRTPAWVGIYRFVVEGRPLDEIFRFIEGHRGYRPGATVTLLYNRVLPRLAPERFMNDPTAALLHRCAEGTVDPYYEQLRAEIAGANPDAPSGVHPRAESASASRAPTLTPRR